MNLLSIHFFHKNKLNADEACGVMNTVGIYVNPLRLKNLVLKKKFPVLPNKLGTFHPEKINCFPIFLSIETGQSFGFAVPCCCLDANHEICFHILPHYRISIACKPKMMAVH